ncbi:MAG: hypothetical protein ACI9DF_004226, partial [Verrucomicrobiales bacterium]
MRSIVILFMLCGLFASCSTVRVSESVNASREATRDAFGRYVLDKGGFITNDSDLSARANMVTNSFAAAMGNQQILNANFGGSHPCHLVLLPQV